MTGVVNKFPTILGLKNTRIKNFILIGPEKKLFYFTHGTPIKRLGLKLLLMFEVIPSSEDGLLFSINLELLLEK
jgi:hypothetical protein